MEQLKIAVNVHLASLDGFGTIVTYLFNLRNSFIVVKRQISGLTSANQTALYNQNGIYINLTKQVFQIQLIF